MRNSLSRVSVIVSLLSLLVAVSATSYAAGVARNSVGTAQLKRDAVTREKLAPRSVGTAELFPGTLPPDPVTVRRTLAVGDTTKVTVGGVRFTFSCIDDGGVDVTRLDFGPAKASDKIDVSGVAGTDAGTTSFYADATSGAHITALPTGGESLATASVVGQVARGLQPVALVTATLRTLDGANPPCLVALTVTPTE